MTPRGAAVYGAGGHGKVVASILRACGIPIMGFFDDAYTGPGQEVQGVPVIGRCSDILSYRDQIAAAYLAVGDNSSRSKAFQEIHREGIELPALIHPKAHVEPDATIGDGTVICMGALVGTEAAVGRGCILNTGCCLDHESTVGDMAHLAPRVAVAGRSSIGELTFVGMGAVIAQGLKIGSRVVIGANSVVLRDITDGSKAVGVLH